MAKKKLPTQKQQEVLNNHGLNVITWEVIKDLPNSLTIKHRITGDMKVVEKHGPVHS